MLDEMAGNVLAVLMYIGAFHDLLKGCGEGGVCSTTLLNLHRSKSSVRNAVTEDFSLQNNGEGAIYLRDSNVLLASL